MGPPQALGGLIPLPGIRPSTHRKTAAQSEAVLPVLAFCLSDSARVIPSLRLCPLSWVDKGLSVLKKAESVVNHLVPWTWLLSSLSRMAIPYSVTSPSQSLAFLPKTCLLLNYIGLPWLESAQSPYRHIHLSWRPPEARTVHGQLHQCVPVN